MEIQDILSTDYAETTSSLDLNIHPDTGPSTIQLNDQDCPNHACANVENTLPLEIEIKSQEITTESTDYNTRTKSTMEIQLNNVDITTEHTDAKPVIIPLEIAIKSPVICTESTNDSPQKRPTMEIQVIYSHLGTDHADANVKTTPSLDMETDPIDDNAQTRSTMDIQLNNQNLSTALIDVNKEATPSTEIQIKNQNLSSDHIDANKGTTPSMEIQINNQNLSSNGTDANKETTLSKEIQMNNQNSSDHIDVKGETIPSMKIQIQNQNLSCDHTDAIVETTPMEIQINNKDLLIDHSGSYEKTKTANSENDYQYRNLFTDKTLLPLYTASWSRKFRSKDNDQTYVRGCKWSPDGTCCLTVVNNDGIHLAELPGDLLSGSIKHGQGTDVLTSSIHMKESGLVYDFCWYPFMNSQIPASCGWITTKQRAPVQLWDAFDGSLRASYRGFNAVDEMEPAISVTFSVDGTRIIAGYKKVLRTFDIERPGRDFAEHKITSPASCFAVSSNLMAMGSWNTSISLYSVSERGTYKSVGKLHGHSGGVTHMKFTPDGKKLVSGARKDHRLLIWDIRYFRRPLNILSRVVDTNQRIYFDISPCGRYLVTGGTDGNVKVWDVEHVKWTDSLNIADDDDDNPTRTFPLHQDCCNSVSIHPYMPILATGSGQYHLDDPKKSLDDDNNGGNIILDESSDVDRNGRDDKEDSDAIDMKYSSQVENKLVLWWTAECFDPPAHIDL